MSETILQKIQKVERMVEGFDGYCYEDQMLLIDELQPFVAKANTLYQSDGFNITCSLCGREFKKENHFHQHVRAHIRVIDSIVKSKTIEESEEEPMQKDEILGFIATMILEFKRISTHEKKMAKYERKAKCYRHAKIREAYSTAFSLASYDLQRLLGDIVDVRMHDDAIRTFIDLPY